jgi:hypothetical protein
MSAHAKAPVSFLEQLAEHLAIIRARTEGKDDMWGYLPQAREEAYYLIEQNIFVSRSEHEAEIQDIEQAYDNGLIPSLEDTITTRDRQIDKLSRENSSLKDAIVELKPKEDKFPPCYGVKWKDGDITPYGNLMAALAAFDKWHWPDRNNHVEKIVVRDVSDWRDYDDRIDGNGDSGRNTAVLLAPLLTATRSS